MNLNGAVFVNKWTKLSAEIAQTSNYLDRLYEIYPLASNSRRKLPEKDENEIRAAFSAGDGKRLIKSLLNSELFPIKDSYVAYLKKDRESINRNLNTVDRIAKKLFKIGIEEIIEKCTEPKETNRQMGPMFKRWVDKGKIGVPVFKNEKDFLKCGENCIFNSSDAEMKKFASRYLGFGREKGIDFIARVNNKYVVAEAKFLTDFGGHQNAQFADAISTMQADYSKKNVDERVIPIAIMDGVLYIKGNNKMYRYLERNSEQIILSALVLKDFLRSL